MKPSALRTDIQLLRGVAILGVMFAHFGGLLPGGFLGVDIFFAISGFVITRSFLKMRALEANTSRLLKKFWRRRFWRLFPALATVLTVTLMVALFLLPADDFGDHFEMSFWSLLFAGNIGVEVVSQGDYFDPASDFNWLTHLWSLGVEEQFYLLFPFFMLFLLSRFQRESSQRFIVLAVAIGSMVSFLLAGINEFEVAFSGQRLSETTGFSAALGYYSPLTRAWQFGVGIIAALLSARSSGLKISSPLSAAGLAMIAVSLFTMPESNLLPGPPTLVPMAGMFLLLRYPIATKLADSAVLKPLRWLGDRSYSAYLWHWPVWSVLLAIFNESFALIVSAFVATLVLAELSYRYIERPLMDQYRKIETDSNAPATNARPSRFAIAALLISPIVVGGTIFGIDKGLRFAGLLGQRSETVRINPELDCLQTSCIGEKVDVLLIGDSHAGALANAFSSSLEESGFSMRGAIMPGCLHLPSRRISSIDEQCQALSSQVRSLIVDLDPSYVVTYGYTAGRFTSINSGGDSTISLVDNKSKRTILEEGAVLAYRLALIETSLLVTSENGRLFVVSGTPDFDLRPEYAGERGEPASLGDLFISAVSGRQLGQISTREEQAIRHNPFRKVEQEIADNNEAVSWIDSWDSVCGLLSCSQIDADGTLLFTDQDHLSGIGAQRLAKNIASAIQE